MIVSGTMYSLVVLAVPLTGTLAIELGTGSLMGMGDKRSRRAIVAVNLITNPAVVALTLLSVYVDTWMRFGRHLDTQFSLLPFMILLSLEIAVVFLEGWLLRWALTIDARRALAVSAVMNATSALSGFALASWLWKRWL